MSASVSPLIEKQVLCTIDDLIENSGVCAFFAGKQIALFYVPSSEQKIFAIDNWDPIGEAMVLSRGIIGDVSGELVVASPLYKQHFSLATGQCLEQDDISVATYSVSLVGNDVILG